jgi:hypothetical protein
MTLKTAGSNSTTNLSGQQVPAGFGTGTLMSDADIASIATSILNDQDPSLPVPGAWARMGLLYVPNRGVLKTYPGDWVLYDPSGFPIVLPAISMPSVLTLTGTTNATTTLTVTTSALVAGWQVGLPLSAAQNDIPAGTKITNISANGLTITMSAAATGSNAGQTITGGNWSHS